MKIAILATGGIESTLLMYRHKNQNPYLISINYGQLAWDIQKKLVLYHKKNLSLSSEFIEIKIQFHDWQKEQGLFKKKFIPTEKNPLKSWNEIPHTGFFIEGRTSIMFCYAMAYCSSNNIKELLTGFEYEADEWDNLRSVKCISDDCSPHFLDTINILAMSGFSNVVRVRAPFFEERKDKKATMQECKDRGIDLDKTYSCYFWPGPCEKCENCLLRAGK